MDDTNNGPYVCEQCGSCCRASSATVWASSGDVIRWLRERRYDIIRHFALSLPDGSRLNALAIILNPPDTHERVSMRSPETGEPYECCPFLEQDGLKSRCRIHETKPERCRGYRPWEWVPDAKSGTDFNCPAVRRKIQDETR
jgi:Fe-S-cluster containining protein